MKPALPDDLREYLSTADRKLKLDGGEIRELTFFAAGDVPLKSFDVDSYGLFANGLLTADPDERREYQGYDLIQACNDYEPEGVLVWFPEFGEYGSWDGDHLTIVTYPDVTWSEIAADPTWYVNGQWYPDTVKHRQINPWESDT